MTIRLDRSTSAVIALLDGRASDSGTLQTAARAATALAVPLTVLRAQPLQARSLRSGGRVIEPWERMEASERLLRVAVSDTVERAEVGPARIEVRFGSRPQIAAEILRSSRGSLVVTARASLAQGGALSDLLLQHRLAPSLMFADDPQRVLPGNPWPDTQQVLGRHPLFQGVRSREVRAAAANLDLVRVAAGQTLIREGRRNATFWLFLEGSAAISIGAVPRRTVARGDFVGAFSLLSGQPAPATVVTTTPVHALVASRAQFDGVLSNELVRLRVQAAYAERFGNDLLALGGGAAA